MNPPQLTLNFSGEDAATVVQSLNHCRQLLILSEKQLRESSEFLGNSNNLQSVLFNEIDHRLAGKHRRWEYGGDRYNDLSSKRTTYVFMRDFTLVSKLSQNQNECFRLLLSRAFVSVLWRGRGYLDQKDSDFVDRFDLAMLELFKRQTKYMKARGIKNWDVTFWFKALDEVPEKYERGFYAKDREDNGKEGNTAWDSRRLPSKSLFETSFSVLRTTLSRRTAHMVVQKIAGVQFPYELVDMIAEDLYDKELLQRYERED